MAKIAVTKCEKMPSGSVRISIECSVGDPKTDQETGALFDNLLGQLFWLSTKHNSWGDQIGLRPPDEVGDVRQGAQDGPDCLVLTLDSVKALISDNPLDVCKTMLEYHGIILDEKHKASFDHLRAHVQRFMDQHHAEEGPDDGFSRQ